MALMDELRSEVEQTIAIDTWKTRDGNVVPESKDIGLGNDAVKLNGTVLYADLSDSTGLVQSHKAHFAAEIYKTYLHCAAKIIRAEGGTITAYDGDRVMAVYLGDFKNTSAARTALKINYAVKQVINPALKAQYPSSSYQVQQVVGIDTSTLWVARTGIRGSNDLVWVGRAANYAAKLCTLPAQYASRITGDVYDMLHASAKVSEGKAMWEQVTWNAMSNMIIYRSTWSWKI
jgi:class 3 adenylate cyclase